MKSRAGFLSCVLAAASLLFTACDGSNSSPTATSGNGTLAVQMTDASTDLVSSVNVYVKAVTIKPQGRAAVQIASDVGMVDVLELKGTVRELVAASVAAGEHEWVQIDFDKARSNVVLKATGTVMPCQMSSESVRVNGGFIVKEGSRTTVLLDFQADQSLQLMGDGTWLLAAVIVQVSVQVDV